MTYSDTGWYLLRMVKDSKSGPARLSREQSRASTRARLVASAIDLIARRGIPDTSLHDIAEEAGFSRGAFHSNFSDKFELHEAIMTTVMAEAEPILSDILTSDTSSGQRLADYIRAYLTYCFDNPAKAKAVVAIVGHQGRHGIESYQTRAEGSLEALVTLFKDGQRRGEMRKFKPQRMALLLRTALDAETGRLPDNTSRANLRETTTELIETFTRATRKDAN